MGDLTRAAILKGPGTELVVEDVRPAPLRPGQVRIGMGAAGICPSDVFARGGDEAASPAASPTAWPVVLGHEGVGIVEEVGSGVDSVRVGDRVLTSFFPNCGHCFWCVNEQTHLCERHLTNRSEPKPLCFRADGQPVYSTTGLGTLAQSFVASGDAVVKVETDLPDQTLAIFGCAVVTGVFAALNTAAVRPGSTVAVFGLGGIGQAVVQGCVLASASRIVAVDPVAAKRDLATGASHVVDPSGSDPVELVRELTHGRGADYAFEASGIPDVARQAFRAVRRGGTLVAVGALPHGVAPPWDAFEQVSNEKRVLGSLYGSAQVRRDFPLLIDLVESGRLDVDGWVSRVLPLERANEALDAMAEDDAIRSVVVS